KTLGDVKYLVPFLIALLLLGNLNSTIFGCSRYVFAGARNNVMPSFLECVHPSSMSPRAAVLIELCVAIGVSFLGNLDQLLSYMTFAMWMQRTIVQIALIWMRLRGWTFPKDAFRTPIIVPLVFFCICIMLLVLPVKDDYHVAIYGVSALLAGMLMYFVFVYPTNKPAIFYRVNGSNKA
ncbi:Protein AAT-7, partial [Aphelenchoides avenae]